MKSTALSPDMRKILWGLVFAAGMMNLSFADKIPPRYPSQNAGGQAAPSFVVTNAATISNDALKLIVSDRGAIDLETVKGDPDNSNDDKIDLLFGDMSNGYTTWASVQIGTIGYIYGGTKGSFTTQPTKVSANEISSTWVVGDFSIEQSLSFIRSSSGRNDLVLFKYNVTNTASTSKTMSLGLRLDTKIGSNFFDPIRIPNVGKIGFEMELTSTTIPSIWLAFDSFTDPEVVASSLLKDLAEIPIEPTRVVFADWAIIGGDIGDSTQNIAMWTFTHSTSNAFGDTLVVVYWDDITFAAGETKTFATTYGLGGASFMSNTKMTAGFTTPARLSVSVTTSTFQYSPSPFLAYAFYENSSGADLTGVFSDLKLPGSLKFDNDNAIKKVETTGGTGVFSKGSETENTWDVSASVRKTGRQNIRLVVQSSEEEIVLLREIVVPGIPNAIWGEVTDKNGDTLSGVTITAFQGGQVFGAPSLIRPASLGPSVGSASSQSDGKYIISNLSPGIYTVRMAGGGVQPTFYVTEVTADDTAEFLNPINFGPSGEPGLETFPHPNPVRSGNVQIAFFVASAGGNAEVKIYSASGMLIEKKEITVTAVGWWNVPWKISGTANGIYFYTVEFGGQSGKGKIAVLKSVRRE